MKAQLGKTKHSQTRRADVDARRAKQTCRTRTHDTKERSTKTTAHIDTYTSKTPLEGVLATAARRLGQTTDAQ